MNPLKALDRTVLDAVVWVSIALSRRGWRKSIQTYALKSMWLFQLVATVLLDVLEGDFPLWAATLVLIVFLAIAAMDILTYRVDVMAEARMLLTPSDRPLPGQAFFKIFIVGAIVVQWWAGGSMVKDAIYTVGWSAWILEIYLRHAPRQPPPKKQEQEVPSHLVPARQGS